MPASRKGTGTAAAPGERMFIAPYPVSGAHITLVFTKLKGKAESK